MLVVGLKKQHHGTEVCFSSCFFVISKHWCQVSLTVFSVFFSNGRKLLQGLLCKGSLNQQIQNQWCWAGCRQWPHLQPQVSPLQRAAKGFCCWHNKMVNFASTLKQLRWLYKWYKGLLSLKVRVNFVCHVSFSSCHLLEMEIELCFFFFCLCFHAALWMNQVILFVFKSRQRSLVSCPSVPDTNSMLITMALEQPGTQIAISSY